MEATMTLTGWKNKFQITTKKWKKDRISKKDQNSKKD
jgi:hypothetical protein